MLSKYGHAVIRPETNLSLLIALLELLIFLCRRLAQEWSTKVEGNEHPSRPNGKPTLEQMHTQLERFFILRTV